MRGVPSGVEGWGVRWRSDSPSDGADSSEEEEAFPQAANSALGQLEYFFGRQDHSHMATGLSLVSLICFEMGLRDDAVKTSKKASEMADRLYKDKDDLALSATLYFRSVTLRELSRNEEAYPFAERAVEINRRLFPSADHLALGLSLNHYAWVLWALGERTEAESFGKECLEVMRNVAGGESHLGVAAALRNHAEMLREMGRADEALPEAKGALEMMKALHGSKPHPDVATSLVTTSSVYSRLGELRSALKCAKEAQEICDHLYQDKNRPVAMASLTNLAITHVDMERYEEAEVYGHKALGMFQSIPKKIPVEWEMRLYRALARINKSLGHYDEARKYAETVLQHETKRPGEDRSVVTAAQGLVEEIESAKRAALTGEEVAAPTVKKVTQAPSAQELVNEIRRLRERVEDLERSLTSGRS